VWRRGDSAALERVVQPKLAFELLGSEAVRAFDATVVIVSLSARQEARASRSWGLPDRDRRTTRRGSCCLERDEPHSRQFFRDAMKGYDLELGSECGARRVWWSGSRLGGGAGGSHAGAVEPAVRDSAGLTPWTRLAPRLPEWSRNPRRPAGARQPAPRPAHPDSTELAATPLRRRPSRGRRSSGRGVRLFDKEGKALVGAAPSPEPTFEHRRFELRETGGCSNTRVLPGRLARSLEIWLGRLARYEG